MLCLKSGIGPRHSYKEKIGESEFRSNDAERLLIAKETKQFDLPLEGSIMHILEEVDKEWQDKGKIRCFRSHNDEKYTVDVNIIDRANSDKDRHEAIQALFQLFQSMAAVNARVMLNSVTMRRGLYLKNMVFKNEATENKLLRQSEIGPKLFGGKFFVALYSSAENQRDAKETQHLRNLK